MQSRGNRIRKRAAAFRRDRRGLPCGGALQAGDVSRDLGDADAVCELFERNRKSELLLERKRELEREDGISAHGEKIGVAVEVRSAIQQSRPGSRGGLLDGVVPSRVGDPLRLTVQAIDLVLKSTLADRRRKFETPHLSERRSRHVPPVDERDSLGGKSKGRGKDRADLGRRGGEREIPDIVDRDEYREGLAASRIARREGAVQWSRIDLGECAARLDRLFNLGTGIFARVDDDQLFLPADDSELAVVEHAKVAGSQPAVGSEEPAGLGWVANVA